MNILSRLIYKLKRLPHRAFAPDSDLSICLCGDFMLDGRIEPYLQKYGMMYSFKNLMPLLNDYDVRALNLETPISDRAGEKWPNKKFNFKGAPYLAQMIKRAGFDYVSLSNNHIVDFGPDVMKDTMKNLDIWGIKYSDATLNPKIAFLSFMDLDSDCCPAGMPNIAICMMRRR